MHFITFILKNAGRRPLRSGLTVVAVAIAVSAMVALVGISNGFESSYMEIYEKVGIDMVVVQKRARQRLGSYLPETLRSKMEQIPGVQEVLPGMLDLVSFDEYGLYGVLVQGHEPGSSAFGHLKVVEGRMLRPDDRSAVMLGSVISANLGKVVGDKIRIYEEEFEIVGIYDSFNVYENGSIVMTIKELQRLMDRPGLVTGFSIVLRKPYTQDDLQRVRKEIEALQEGLSAMPAREHVDTILEIQIMRAMAWLTSAVALVIGTVGIMNTMIMSVHERTHEIGVLRAIGWRRSRIVRMIVIESVVLSIVGAIVGALAAILLVRVLTNLPNVQGLIAGRVGPEVVAQGFVVALSVGLLGGILPAIRATRMAPTTALRHE